MIKIVRTDSSNPDFVSMVEQLDLELAILDGKDHAFYAQFNSIDQIKHVVLAYEGEMAVACGAFKKFDEQKVEIKRMYTYPAHRENGFASIVLKELEGWAIDLSYSSCILETGLKQVEAIGLYSKLEYVKIPNYGQYKEVEGSVCFEKIIVQHG